MESNLAYQATLKATFQEAVDKTTAALKEEGFGVLTTIDVQATLKDKLGKEVPSHVILGACNPPLAHKALSSAPLVGLLLPCNVTVRQTEAGCQVSIVNPETLLSVEELGQNADLQAVAAEASQRLQRVVDSLRG